MNRRQVSIAVSCALSLCCATAPAHKSDQVRTQLQTREFQTRTYETTDTNMIMKALLNVLQDDGFIIKTVNTDLGLITANKDHSNTHPGFVAGPFIPQMWDCSVNVNKFGAQTKVRVNVQVTARNKLNETDVYELDDPSYYQTFFAKVDKGIFIQKEKL